MDPELQAILDDIAAAEDAALASTEEALEARLAELAALTGAEITDEVLGEMESVAAGIVAVRDEASRRITESETRAARAAEIMNSVVVETPAEDPPAEDDPAETPAEGDPPAEVVTDPPAEGVAAAAVVPARPALRAVAARRPAARAPAPEQPRIVITAAADVPGIPVGGAFTDMNQVAASMIRMRGDIGKGDYRKFRVATINVPFPAERILDDNATENARKIEAAVSPEAIIASGGICAPVAPYYEQANISTDARPLRDSLAGFRADRGGIAFVAPPSFSSFDDAVALWSAANDEDPGSDGDATKPCARVVCTGTTEVLLDAIPMCLEFGNLGARAWPEQVRDATDKTRSWHARFAERRILQRIDTLSTATTSETVLGAARDILTTLGRAAAGYRYRHRTPRDLPLRVVLAAYVRDMMVVDLTRQLPGDDKVNVALAEIDGYFASRNLNVTWTLDEVAGFTLTDPQAGGPLGGWPSEVRARIFHEGAFLFLDGGTLDLGLVRDSDLNSSNDYRIFSETFEAVAKVGLESVRIDIDVCPDGSTSGTVDINPCGSGS